MPGTEQLPEETLLEPVRIPIYTPTAMSYWAAMAVLGWVIGWTLGAVL